MAEWDIAKANALKILGKGGEVPDMPDTVQKAADNMGDASRELDKCREDCEAKVLALQNGNDAVKNALKQFQAKIDKENFKLDPKKPDELKKIQQARALLSGRLTRGIKHYTDDDKVLDELDKHLIQLGKYKPSPGI